MAEFSENVRNQFAQLPVPEDTMKQMFQTYREQAMLTFKQGVLSGSDLLNTPKGEEFLQRLESEQAVLTS